MSNTLNSAPPAPVARTRAARAAVWITVLVVALHVTAIALWIGPDNQLRRHVGVSHLARYVLPVFDQNWSVFAPEADFGNDMFSVRAELRGADGAVTQTGWVKVTAREIVPAVRYHPFPSRTSAITNRLATEQVKTYGALTPAQQNVVAASGADVSLDLERTRLLAASQSPAERLAVTGFMKVETAVEYFLSGIADAIWGTKLVAFQVQRYRLVVPNYESWHGSRLADGGNAYTSPWRPVHALTPVDRSAYAAYVAKFGIR